MGFLALEGGLHREERILEMIEQYGVPIVDMKSFEAEKQAVFATFRAEMRRWEKVNSACRVALGGDDHSGDWSVVFEEGFWLAFVGERGVRHHVCLFTNVWDALSYAGYRAVLAATGEVTFPLLRP